MADDLLTALTTMQYGPKPTFVFQHRLCHDFESLIWVVVYAMMIHHRNILALTDPEKCEQYKKSLDHCWAAHAYSNLLRSHDHMTSTGCKMRSQAMVDLWFPDPLEAAFFRDAMRLIRTQTDQGSPISYEGLCALFKKHIKLAQEPEALHMVSE